MTDPTRQPASTPLTVLYCRCAYAKVVPDEVKDEVLASLCAAGKPFETVADLCEMSARRDPALNQIADRASEGGVKIAACFPRAVRSMFQAAGAPLPEAGIEILNMREATADQIVAQLDGHAVAATKSPHPDEPASQEADQ